MKFGTRSFNVIVVVMILFFMVLCLLGYKMNRASGASSNWMSTTGRVVKSIIHEHYQVAVKSGRSSSYSPIIHYEYSTPSGTYKSNKVNYFGAPQKPGKFGKKQVNDFLDLYLPGKQITVYYNPDNHRQAVLIRGTTRTGLALIVLGGFGILITFCFVGLQALDNYGKK